MGREAYLHFRVKAPAPAIARRGGEREEAGSGAIAAGAGETAFVARVGARSRADAGDHLELVVDTAALHFFDPETGRRVAAVTGG
jgi:hypothetical protein